MTPAEDLSHCFSNKERNVFLATNVDPSYNSIASLIAIRKKLTWEHSILYWLKRLFIFFVKGDNEIFCTVQIRIQVKCFMSLSI